MRASIFFLCARIKGMWPAERRADTLAYRGREQGIPMNCTKTLNQGKRQTCWLAHSSGLLSHWGHILTPDVLQMITEARDSISAKSCPLLDRRLRQKIKEITQKEFRGQGDLDFSAIDAWYGYRIRHLSDLETLMSI